MLLSFAQFEREIAGERIREMTPARLLRLSKNLPHDWKEQRRFLGFAV
jgi:hypothetical protein